MSRNNISLKTKTLQWALEKEIFNEKILTDVWNFKSLKPQDEFRSAPFKKNVFWIRKFKKESVSWMNKIALKQKSIKGSDVEMNVIIWRIR